MGGILRQQKLRRKNTQRTILKMAVEKVEREYPKLGKRVRRWGFGGNEVAREARLLERLKEVNSDFPPRVASSYMSFVWNGMGTCRR